MPRWTIDTALTLMANRPTDLDAESIKKRLTHCQSCPHRVGNECQLARQQISVHALKKKNNCPAGKWEHSRLARSMASPEPTARTLVTSQPTSPNFILETDRIAQEITIGFTAFKRPALVKRLYDSIRRYYPKILIIIADNGDEPADLPAEDPNLLTLELPFDCGISVARNAMVDELKTPYLWLLDDDLVFTNETAAGRLLEVLDCDPSVGVAGGNVWDYRAGCPTSLLAWAQDMREQDRQVTTIPAAGTTQQTPQGTPYYYADTAQNFALFRKEFLKDYRWDPRYKIQEHFPYYWEVKHSPWKVAIVESVRVEHRRETTPTYAQFRNRNREHFVEFLEAAGLKSVEMAVYHQLVGRDGSRPNLIIFGIGNSGTTPAVKMAHQLGWHRADADETFGESVALRSLNDRLLAKSPVTPEEMADYLAALPQPWAIKDPRLVLTLDYWRQYLARYQPALVWITRDPAAVTESRRKRGESAFREGKTYADAYAKAAAGFLHWTGPKIRLELESLVAAAAIISPERFTAKRLSKDRAVEAASYIPGWMRENQLGWIYEAATQLPPGGLWVELGTYAGRSLAAAAYGLPEACRLIAVDHDPAPELERTLRALRLARPDLTIEFMESDTAQAALVFADSAADLVFIDADHSAQSVRSDCEAWWPKIKSGGRLAGHDYNWPGVRQGIEAAGLEVRPANALWWCWKE